MNQLEAVSTEAHKVRKEEAALFSSSALGSVGISPYMMGASRGLCRAATDPCVSELGSYH